MRSYSVAEAKDRFQEMLDHVKAGETVNVTENGESVAEIHRSPEAAFASPDRKALIEKLQGDFAALRAKAKPVTQDEIREWRMLGLK